MIVQWPEHVFSMILPPGMEQIITQSSSYRAPMRPPAPIMPKEKDVPQEKPTLVATVSHSEDDDSVVGGSRRVRFDSTVEIQEIPKRRKQQYPKTPPPKKKKASPSQKKKQVQAVDNEKTKAAVTPPRPNASESVDMTPRRRSLRSASKKLALAKNDERSVECTVEENEVTVTSTPTRVTQARRQTSVKKTTPARRSSRRSVGGTPQDNATPTRSLSLTDTQKAKLRSLSLLSRMPKQDKRDLLDPLLELRKLSKPKMSDGLLAMAENQPKAATELLYFLTEAPELVDTVVAQLRNYAG